MNIKTVIDTRRRDDHGHIIPDSGDTRPCDICGRPHDIHVALSDGRIVGKTCAAKLGLKPWAPIPQRKIDLVPLDDGRIAEVENGRAVIFWRGRIEDAARQIEATGAVVNW